MNVFPNWVWISLYILTFLVTFRLTYPMILYRGFGLKIYDDEVVEPFDRGMGAFLAMCIALFGPLVLVGYVFYKIATPKTVAEKRQEIREMEDRRQQLKEEITQLKRDKKNPDE